MLKGMSLVNIQRENFFSSLPILWKGSWLELCEKDKNYPSGIKSNLHSKSNRERGKTIPKVCLTKHSIYVWSQQDIVHYLLILQQQKKTIVTLGQPHHLLCFSHEFLCISSYCGSPIFFPHSYYLSIFRSFLLFCDDQHEWLYEFDW